MTTKSAVNSIEKYIAGLPTETQKALKKLRTLIKKTAPGATERISYGIPTFDLNGQYVIYIAGWKKHVSIYPITRNVAREFAEEVKPYKHGKATVQFPIGEPMPLDLIRRIVKFRVEEIKAAKPKRGR